MPVVTRAQRVLVLVPVAALALVACGESATPAQRVQNATSTVFDAEQVTVSVGLDLDEASRDAVLRLVAENQADAEQQISPAAVERLLGARVVTTMATTDGTMLSELDLTGVDVSAGAQPTNVSTSVSFVVEEEPLVELRQVTGILYARADVAGLETAMETPGLADGIASFTEGAPPALAEAAEALASGGWVSLDTAALTAQLEELSEVAPAPSEATPDASAAAGAVQKFLDDARAVITREVEVTEKGDDAYTVSAPLDRILTGLTPSLKAVVTDLAAQSGAPLESIDAELDSGLADAQEALAGREATVEVTLDGDRLSTVRMDVAQFLDADARADMTADGVIALPVVIELDEDGEVPAPEGAVELDVAQIMEQMLGGMAGVEG